MVLSFSLEDLVFVPTQPQVSFSSLSHTLLFVARTTYRSLTVTGSPVCNIVLMLLQLFAMCKSILIWPMPRHPAGFSSSRNPLSNTTFDWLSSVFQGCPELRIFRNYHIKLELSLSASFTVSKFLTGLSFTSVCPVSNEMTCPFVVCCLESFLSEIT